MTTEAKQAGQQDQGVFDGLVHHLELRPPPLTGGGPRVPVAQRIARGTKVIEPGGCRVWTGPLLFNGYAMLKIGPKKVRAHRAAFELIHGPIPDGMVIDHLCRNRACCNPDHMEVVTPAENTRRGNSPSAITARTGMCRNGHAMTPENTILGTKGSKSCAICRRDYQRYYRRRCRAAARANMASALLARGEGQ